MAALIETYKSFFSNMNWKMTAAATLMTITVVAIAYLAYIVYKVIISRMQTLQVYLPDIQQIDRESQESKPQFKEEEVLSVIMVDPNEKVEIPSQKEYNKDTFDKIISMEVKKYIPNEEEYVSDMPIVEDFDIEALKKQKFEEAVKERERQAQRLREIAQEDEKDFDYILTDLRDGGN